MPGTAQEFHYGIVTNDADPEKRGRLKVRCQSLTSANTELPDWVEPENPPFSSNKGGGGLWLPRIGSTVELAVSVHDNDFDERPGERFLANPSIKWRYATPTGVDDASPLPELLRTNYPHRRGWVTPAGHAIVFDDSPNGETIKIISKFGQVIEMKKGAITITDPSGDIVLNGGALGVARATDPVQVSIPIGTVHVTNPIGTPPTIPNPAPIPLSGTIVSGAPRTKA